MGATYWDTLLEVGGRRVLLVLVIMGLGIGLLFGARVKFSELSGVEVILQGPINMGPWPLAVPAILGQLTGFIGIFWCNLLVIVGCPLLVSTSERGWRELIFSKGKPRWRIFLGRYLAIITLFLLVALTSFIPLAMRLWWHTGISTWQVIGATLIETFSFASLLSVGALLSTTGEGAVAMPIIASMGMMGVSALLFIRQDLFNDYITSDLGRRIIDWLYYILPKNGEIDSTATAFIQTSVIATSWPLWTTGLFTLGTMTLTLWLLQRKSF